MSIIGVMKKLNLYITKQILIGFLLVSFSLMSIIWLTQSLRFVDLITNKGISVGLFAEMTSLLMPRIFTILSPISLFAAVLFVYNRMLSDRELVVMKAAGISPWQNAKPALFMGVLMALFNVYVMNFGIPMAENRFNDLQWQVKNDVSHLMFREGEFTTLQDNLTVFITTHEPDGSVSGILINDERNPKSKSTISAELGRIVHTDKGPRIILVNGNRQEVNNSNNQFSSVIFDRYSVDFGAKETKSRKEAGAREQSLTELLTAGSNPNLEPKEARRWVVEGNKRFTAASSKLFLCPSAPWSSSRLLTWPSAILRSNTCGGWLSYTSICCCRFFSACICCAFTNRFSSAAKSLLREPLMLRPAVSTQLIFIAALLGSAAARAGSIVLPDTKKTVAEVTNVDKPRINPQVNITDVFTPKPPTDEDNPEIYFSADEVENNQELSLITATGHVEIIRDNYTVNADKIIYNQKDDTVTAVGNVVILEDSGNVVFSDYAELTDRMTKGEMKNIKMIMVDKTRIAASTFRRGDKDKKIMTNAVYSPCDSCRGENPLWQIKARKVEHNAETKDVNYQNATVEVKGVPVFYTPFLSHPDPTVKRRSGFLFPRIMSNQYLGAAIQGQYFWSINDQQDILFNPVISSDKGIVYSGAYNQYFTRGNVSATGSFLRDPDSKEDRGNIFAAQKRRYLADLARTLTGF